eukprot:ANDGO_01540.mRNA.1 hypothetical protein
MDHDPDTTTDAPELFYFGDLIDFVMMTYFRPLPKTGKPTAAAKLANRSKKLRAASLPMSLDQTLPSDQDFEVEFRTSDGRIHFVEYQRSSDGRVS